MVPARLAVGACLASHLLRSAFAPDLTSTLTIELQSFRAEVSEAKAALSRSTLILEHCQTQTGVLTWALKFLAFTEFALLIWVGWLLIDRRLVKHKGREESLVIEDLRPSSVGVPESSLETSVGTAPSRSVVQRTGPLRPSDLKKDLN